MKCILLVHNRYQERGGEDAVFEAEANLLRRFGHAVASIEFANDDIPTQRSAISSLNLAVSTVWSRSATARITDAIRAHHPDVAHVHNILPLASPSVYVACHSEGVPVVQTLHNYRLVCPNALLYREGRVCEDCLVRSVPWPGIRHACYRDSRAQTATVAAMVTAHRVRGTWDKDVDRYIALTEFARQTFIRGGLPADRIAVKPNFLPIDPMPSQDVGDCVLFVGRLAEYKGLLTIADAWSKLPQAVPLRIVGDGPLRETLSQRFRDIPHVQVLGRLPASEVATQMRTARAVLLPSLLYENFPLTIVEAFGHGRPMLVSRLGAMAELVTDGETGLTFTAGDADDLAAKALWAWSHPEQMHQMGIAARAEYEAKYTAERNHQLLIDIYDQAIRHARQKEKSGR